MTHAMQPVTSPPIFPPSNFLAQDFRRFFSPVFTISWRLSRCVHPLFPTFLLTSTHLSPILCKLISHITEFCFYCALCSFLSRTDLSCVTWCVFCGKSRPARLCTVTTHRCVYGGCGNTAVIVQRLRVSVRQK